MPGSRSKGRRGKTRRHNGATAGKWTPCVHVWIDIEGRGSLGPGKLRLLQAVGEHHSLAAAARALGMSYRLAWQHLRLIEQRSGITVVATRRGGRCGGGMELTDRGRLLLEAYQDFQREVEQHMRRAFCRHFAGWRSA